MAKSRNRNRQNTPVAATNKETPVADTPEVIDDTLTQKPAPEEQASTENVGESEEQSGDESAADESVSDAATEESSQETPIDEEEFDETAETETPETELAPELVVEEPVSEERRIVIGLNDKLAELKTLLEGFGEKPESFKLAARKSLDVAKYVLKYPKNDVLDALVVFFVENKDGVASGAEILKGSSTLGMEDEQLVSVLFNLFANIANKRTARVENGFVNGVLKRPEIMTYYNRRIAGIKANR